MRCRKNGRRELAEHLSNIVIAMWLESAPESVRLGGISLEKRPMGKESKTFPIGRNSKTGEFISVKEAKSRPSTTTVERMPKAGHGDTKRK
jgi:hypothetical protein